MINLKNIFKQFTLLFYQAYQMTKNYRLLMIGLGILTVFVGCWDGALFSIMIPVINSFIFKGGAPDSSLVSGPLAQLINRIDFSEEMIRIAQEKYPSLVFLCRDFHEFNEPDQTYEYIILSDLVNDVWDVQTIFNKLPLYCNQKTRIIINTFSRLWELPLSAVRKLKLATPILDQNWLTIPDIRNLLHLSGFEMIRDWSEIILPLNLLAYIQFS